MFLHFHIYFKSKQPESYLQNKNERLYEEKWWNPMTL